QYNGWMIWYQVSHNLYAGAWVQYFTILHPNFPSSQFVEVGSWTNETWDGFYSEARWGAAAIQLHYVRQYTAEHHMDIANAIANIWKVELYDRMTDFWGPI